MDGITFLQKIMSQHPIPVIICSSVAGPNSEATMKALKYGVVDIIQKPKINVRQFLNESRILICDSIKAASIAKLKPLLKREIPVVPKHSADVILAKGHKTVNFNTNKVIVVGASTGGTQAIQVLLKSFPENSPGIVIVQHMPEHFTFTFANHLNEMCNITVKEAEHKDLVQPGMAFIAPGNKHLLLKRYSDKYYIEIKDGPLVSRHRPSVDVLFRSAARYAGKNAIGVIMTGMGDDGASGMMELHQAGALTIAQDEQSCVVFGMPKEAIKANAVDKVLPLSGIPYYILRELHIGDYSTI
jgi:two-component system chemotaxis response regulator CheB